MTEQEARQFVTLLAAHYPRVQLQQAHFDAYTRVVRRYDASYAGVLDTIAAAHVHWPSTAEVAQAFATAAVGAPLPAVAWEQVQALAKYTPDMRPCGPCGGTGDDGPGAPCVYCRGIGDTDVGTPPPVHPVAQRALASMGGLYAARSTREPGMFRAQYLKAYADFLQLATGQAALGGSWQAALMGMDPVPALAART